LALRDLFEDAVLQNAAEVQGARAAGLAEMIHRIERMALVHQLRSRIEVLQGRQLLAVLQVAEDRSHAMALLGHLGLDLDAIERWGEAVPAIRKVWAAISEQGPR
jgi:hypothetical protein